MKLSEMIGGLPTLNQQELSVLRAACDQLIKAPTDALDETSPLFDELASLLGIRLSFRDFHNVPAYTAWKRHAPTVIGFLGDTHPDVSRVMKGALMHFLLVALRDDLMERGVPITIGIMTKNLDRLPEIYDVSFPGYRERGMQHVVEKAMRKQL